MIEQLFNLIKDNAKESVLNNPAVPDDKNEEVVKEATHSIADGLQKEIATGGLQNVLQLFSGQGNAAQHSITNSIATNFMNSLVQKLGFNSQTAQTISNTLIPLIMSKLVHKVNDPENPQFNIQNIFASLTGGESKGFNLGNLMNHFVKNDQDNPASPDSTAVEKITNAAREQQEKEEERGGLLDKLKGLI